MATYEYIIVQNHEQSSTRDHYHSVTISAINAAAAANIPRYAWITRVHVYLRMKHNWVFGTIGNANVNIWLCNNGDDNSGENLCSGESSTSSKEFTGDLTAKVDYLYPFTMNTSYSRLAAYYDSTTTRGYSCELFKIVYEYMIPTYTARFYNYNGALLLEKSVTAGNTPVYDGATPIRPSDAEYDYTFSGWSPSLGPITGYTSYTAQYTATKRTYVTYDSIFNFRRWADNELNLTSWDLIEVSNVTDTGFTGKALVDDAYTLECRPLIQVEAGKTYTFECTTTGGGFEFFVFNCNSSGAWADFTYGNTNKFNFTPSTSYISIRCDVVGTGTVVNFSNFKMYPADCSYMSGTVAAADRSDCNSWSMSTPTREGYTFKGWNTKPDGSGTTYTSASAFPSSDLVLYSQWELQKINKNYVGTSQLKEIYVGTTLVKEVYVGTTKVYG